MGWFKVKTSVEASVSNHFESIVNSLEQPLITLDRRLHVIAFNPAMRDAFQKWTGKLLRPGMNYLEVLPDSSIPDRLDIYKRAFAGEQISIEQDYNLAGEKRTFIVSYNPIIFEGRCEFIIGSAKDITAQKLEEKRHKEANQKFAHAFNYTMVGMALVSPEGQFLQVNPALTQMLGYSEGELLQKTFQILTHPDDLAVNLDMARQLQSGDTPWMQTEKRYLHKGGYYIDAMLSTSLVRDDWGEPQFYVSVIQDITERHRREIQLKESEERFSHIANHAPVFIWLAGPDNKTSFVNKRWLEFVGATPESEKGDGWTQHIHPDDRPRVMKILKEAAAVKKDFEIEYRARRADGVYRWVMDWGAPGFLPDGTFTGYTGTGVDVTEQVEALKLLKETQSELNERANELSRSNTELERFAYVASHDLQEPLRMIVSYLQFLDLEYRGRLSSEADSYLHFAVDGAKRMSTLIRDLLAYSRVGRADLEIEVFPLREVIETAIHQLKVPMDESKAKVEYPERLPSIVGDRSQFVRLFQNIIENSLKYKGDENPVITISATREFDSWIFTIVDNGIGFSVQDESRVFKIFQRFHDREKYPGSGIGLAMSKSIVERHGGKIWAKSTVNLGTEIGIRLPQESVLV